MGSVGQVSNLAKIRIRTRHRNRLNKSVAVKTLSGVEDLDVEGRPLKIEKPKRNTEAGISLQKKFGDFRVLGLSPK